MTCTNIKEFLDAECHVLSVGIVARSYATHMLVTTTEKLDDRHVATTPVAELDLPLLLPDRPLNHRHALLRMATALLDLADGIGGCVDEE